MSLSRIETAAIIAGLRLLQRTDVLPSHIDEVLVDGGELPRITESGIDELCEKINAHGIAPTRVVVAMDGGVIQHVSTDSPARVLMLDYDVEMADAEGVIEVPQMNADGEQDGTERAYVAESAVEADTRWVDLQFENWKARQPREDAGEAG